MDLGMMVCSCIKKVLDCLDPWSTILLFLGANAPDTQNPPLRDTLSWLMAKRGTPKVVTLGLISAVLLPFPLLELGFALLAFSAWYIISLVWMVNRAPATYGGSAMLALFLHNPVIFLLWVIPYATVCFPIACRWFWWGFTFRLDSLKFLYRKFQSQFAKARRRVEASVTPPAKSVDPYKYYKRPPTPFTPKDGVPFTDSDDDDILESDERRKASREDRLKDPFTPVHTPR